MVVLSKEESVQLVTSWLEQIYQENPSIEMMELKYKFLEYWSKDFSKTQTLEHIYSAIEEYEKWIS